MLDHILPLYQVREYHDTVVTATPEAALDALLSLPARSDGVVATLFALRGLRGRGPLRDLMAGMGLHPVTTDRAASALLARGRSVLRVDPPPVAHGGEARRGA